MCWKTVGDIVCVKDQTNDEGSWWKGGMRKIPFTIISSSVKYSFSELPVDVNVAPGSH